MNTRLIKQIINFIVILLWGGIAGYICIGGLTMIEAIEKVKIIENKVEINIVREITDNYSSSKRLPERFINHIDEAYYYKSRKHLSFEEKEAMSNLNHVYWYYDQPGFSYIMFLLILPYTALIFLTVGAAGVLGSIARMIFDHVRNVTLISDSKCFAIPISGFFLGIMVLAISYVIPTIFIRGDTNLNTMSIVLICFFAGFFSDHFYGWISNLIGNFLKTGNEQNNSRAVDE